MIKRYKYFAKAQKIRQSEGIFAQEAMKQAAGKRNSLSEAEQWAAHVAATEHLLSEVMEQSVAARFYFLP